MVSFFSTRIASHNTRKWFLTFSTSLLLFFGFEALAQIVGIYQIGNFLTLAAAIFIFLTAQLSVAFDLRLKLPNSWKRSRWYYAYSKNRINKWLRIVGRAIRLRFGYLVQWDRWMHFQHYLILPTLLFWAVVNLIFLNPFAISTKQVFSVTGTLVLAVVMWHLKFVFISYQAASRTAVTAMAGATFATAFLVFSGLLGTAWYFGLQGAYFYAACGFSGFLLMYQLFFRQQQRYPADLVWAIGSGLLLSAVAVPVFIYWHVNYYSAGLLLTSVFYASWSAGSDFLQHRLRPVSVLVYIAIVSAVLWYVLATTNFSARIG